MASGHHLAPFGHQLAPLRHHLATTWSSLGNHPWHDVTLHITTYHDISWHIMTYHDMPWHAMMWRDVTWRDVTWHNITQMTQVALNQDSPSLANLLLIPSHCNNFTFFHPFRKIFHAPPFGCGMFQKDLPKNALKTNYGLQCGDKMNPFPGSVNVCWADPPIPNPCLMLCLLAPKVLSDSYNLWWPSNLIPSVRHIALNELNRPKTDLSSPSITTPTSSSSSKDHTKQQQS